VAMPTLSSRWRWVANRGLPSVATPLSPECQPQRLLLLKQLTRELAAQEVAVWKKVIRVIAHRVNNYWRPSPRSPTPVSCWLVSPIRAAGQSVHHDRRGAAHLASFIDGMHGRRTPSAKAPVDERCQVRGTLADRGEHSVQLRRIGLTSQQLTGVASEVMAPMSC